MFTLAHLSLKSGNERSAPKVPITSKRCGMYPKLSLYVIATHRNPQCYLRWPV